MLNVDYKSIHVDVAIIGSGIAGLSTIYFLDRTSYSLEEIPSVAIVSKSAIGYGSSTYYSAGAFRCPTGDYTVEDYVRDVLTSGRFINKEYLVKLIAFESLDAITALEELGLRFTRTRGMLRVVSEDPIFPGKEVALTLRKYVLSRSKTVALEGTSALEVVRLPEGFYTVCLSSDGVWYVVFSRVVVLATGGAANAYLRSDNPQQLSCDGHGIAIRLGIPLIDMEFIQFFPLGLAEQGRPSFMLPFTKGRLVNKLGEDVVAKYGLEDLGKAVIYGRDSLSKAMMFEVLNGNDVDGALHLYPELVDDLSRYGYELVSRLKLRIPIKVLPTAHYSMGGIEVDEDLKTGIEGLYAVGEVVGGVHGANRVGGNALTACVVLAKAVSTKIIKYLRMSYTGRPEDDGVIREVISKYSYRDGKYSPTWLRSRVRELMWSKVGIIRVKEGIKECIDELSSYLEGLDKVSIKGGLDVIKYSEALNTLLTSLAIAYSAMARDESRGAHFRLDYPKEDPRWVKNVRIRCDNNVFRTEVIPVKSY